jgi:predicted RNase H-like HicB family nuclease
MNGEDHMLYPVLIQERPDGKCKASVPIIPGLTRVGDTREDALKESTEAISETVSKDELVFVYVPTSNAVDVPTEGLPSQTGDTLVGLFHFGDPNLSENAKRKVSGKTPPE